MKLSKSLSIIHISFIIIALLILIIPWYQLGVEFPNFVAGGKIVIDSKYFVVGFIYIILLLLKFLEYKIDPAPKKDFKVLFALRNASDKIFLEGILMILAYNGFMSIFIPIMIMGKETIVETMKKLSADNGKMMEKSALGLTEKICISLGIILILFYNLPFELWRIFLADVLIIIGAIISVLNGCIYYFRAKRLLIDKGKIPE